MSQALGSSILGSNKAFFFTLLNLFIDHIQPLIPDVEKI